MLSMLSIVVIDASALENIITRMPLFWEEIKGERIKVVIGKPKLIRQYSKRRGIKGEFQRMLYSFFR